MRTEHSVQHVSRTSALHAFQRVLHLQFGPVNAQKTLPLWNTFMFAFLHRCGHKFGLSVNVATTTSLPLPLCSSRLGKAHLKLTFHQPSGSRTNRDADINSGPKHREMVARAIGRGYAQPVDGLFAIPVFEVGRVDLFRQQKQVFGGGSETSAIEVLQRSATGGGGLWQGRTHPRYF